MLEVEASLADLIRAMQEAADDAQILAALIHLLLSDEDGAALAA